MNRILKVVMMKTKHFLSILLIYIFSLIGSTIKAQDTLYVKSESKLIIAKILEVNVSNLKYKKYSNIDGPTYTIEKSNVEKVIYKNGDIENYQNDDTKKVAYNRQTSEQLMTGSKIFLKFSQTTDKRNVDGNDAKEMLESYLKGKTNCVVVNSLDEADFEMELSVIKKIMSDRSAMLTIRHLFSDKEVYSTKWVRGTSNAFSGYSGSRAAIGKLIKKYLVKDYPEIQI